MACRQLWASRAASYLRISVFHRSFSYVLNNMKYGDSHEWVKVDGNSATVGINDHAQDHLGDVVYVKLLEVGAAVTQGDAFGAVESVKATSDANSPVSGKVVEVNEELNSSLGLAAERLISSKGELKTQLENFCRDPNISRKNGIFLACYSQSLRCRLGERSFVTHVLLMLANNLHCSLHVIRRKEEVKGDEWLQALAAEFNMVKLPALLDLELPALLKCEIVG
ncbi:glycine cleavage system H protein 2, mitochondrial-like [Vicia villosa]|uniref:glycine cleavage system H protein 2, mitochondrial-like n=1 Tax=Vicia villosa TaxID=3911 RepID=UPI00273CADEC|nr:glycine cleavage system H protein 2, mitochondrial-like [Vicia villosa]